jgi:2-desacetyl-2-hydroxyethyl bacteriochlorophyllide A dehydrogenase
MNLPKKNPTLVFQDVNQAVLEDRPLNLPEGDDFILIQTEKSIISAGTELACLGGGESWAPFPYVPGYGSVGTIVEMGADVANFSIGDRVFTYGRHEAYSLANTVTQRVPENLAPEEAVFARMAAVAITALRVSEAEFGDCVAVLGLGLVGNFAAQLFTLSGCEVIGVDPSPNRRALAQQCGVAHTLASDADLPGKIENLTHGARCRTVVDATGVPAVVAKAPELAGKYGELVLLGSPRGEYLSDLTPFLNYSHLAKFGNITIKGAHEFRFPIDEHPDQFYRHSFASNVRVILRSMAKGALQTKPLFSHLVKPSEADGMYRRLRESPEDCMGVVYDWTH